MANMLSVNDINVYYGAIHAIQGISFEVPESKVIALIGANGAGKSTILKTISGLLASKSGSIEYMGENILGRAPYELTRKGLSHVMEGRRIFLNLSVDENLDMGGYTLSPKACEGKKEEIFSRFPRLLERKKQVAGTLSGGEQQMLAIGRALMSNPKLLMLDEPSMGLAPILVKQIFDIIKELNSSGVTILLVEQNAKMALTIADYGYVLETGRIKLHDTADNLLKNDEVRKAYLGG